MARHGAITVECAAPDCYATVVYDGKDLDHAAIDDCLSDDGWGFDRAGSDLCPACKAQREKDEAA